MQTAPPSRASWWLRWKDKEVGFRRLRVGNWLLITSWLSLCRDEKNNNIIEANNSSMNFKVSNILEIKIISRRKINVSNEMILDHVWKIRKRCPMGFNGNFEVTYSILSSWRCERKNKTVVCATFAPQKYPVSKKRERFPPVSGFR